MALRVTGGVPLEFTAVLNDDFSSGMAKITEELKKAANESGKTAEKFNKDFSTKMSGSLDKVSASSKVGKNAIGQLTGSLTSLINPTAIISAGLASAAIAVYKYALNSSQAAKQQKILNDIVEEAAKNYGNSAGKIDLLKEKLNDLSVPLKDRIIYANDYNKIAAKANQIDIEQLNNLNAINPKIEAQIKLFKERAMARAAETVVAQKAEAVFKAQLEFDTKFPEFSSATVTNLQSTAASAIESAKKQFNVKEKINVNELLNFADLPDAELRDLAQKNDKFKILLDDRTKNILTNVNRQLKAVDEYKKGTKSSGSGAAVYQTIIDQKQQDLNQAIDIASGLINPIESETKGSTKKGGKGGSINSTLEERKRLIDEIIALQRDSDQSGLTKEQSALDKINEAYDLLIKKITEYNSKVSKGEQIDITSLQAARVRQIQNTTFKENAKDYISSLSVQQKAFEDFENAKLKFGETKAKELFGAQIAGADSYLDYLKKQKDEIDSAVTNQAGKANIQQTIELDILNKKIQDENEKRTRDQIIQQMEGYSALLKEATTYHERKLSINQHYDQLENAASNDKSATEQQTKERLAIIEAGRKEALKALENDVARQSDIYKKMGEDLTFFSKEELKKRAADLQKDLINPKLKLSPATKAAIQSLIDQINDLLNQTDTVPEKFSNIANGLNEISGALNGVDEVLGKNIATLGRLAGAVSTTLQSIKTLSSDSSNGEQKLNAGFGLFGAFFSVVGTINGIINSGAQHRAELKQQEEQQLLSIQTGEAAINSEYRKRLLLQAELNKLRVGGLQAEADALQSNLESTQKDFDNILKTIQEQGKAIPVGFDLDAIKKLQALGVNNSYVQEYNKAASLTGKTFDELQKLDFTGQLDDKAKALFETLKGLRDEIEETTKAQSQNIQETAEQLTGTTSDTIVDSIIEGFKNGKKASKDFADDFESLMRESLFNSLKYQTLKEPLEKLYAQFAADAKSDGVLTETEITNLKETYNTIIAAGKEQYDNLQKLTGIDLSGGLGNSNTNSLKGGISAITENTAEVLAGQIGGLRISAIEQLNIAMQSLNVLNKIEGNTAMIKQTNEYLRKFDQQGIKIQ